MSSGYRPPGLLRGLGRAWAAVRAKLSDRSGAVAILMAAGAPVLLLSVGVAVDYGYASYINQRLAKAMDAAVLSAVSQTTATSAGGYSNVSFLQTEGNNYFAENVRLMNLSNVSANVTVQSNGAGGVVASGNYTYNSPTFFSGIVGRTTIPLSGSMSSTAHPIVYVNYYILVDTSQSMGIAATQADMDALYKRVKDNGNGSDGQMGCVFGCHVQAMLTGSTVQPYTNEYLAHNMTPRINLRIDAAVSAIQGIVSAAANVAGSNANIQFAVYTLQADPVSGTQFTRVAPASGNPPTSADYNTVSNLASTITLGNNTKAGIGDSDFFNELLAFNTQLTSDGVKTNGSGVSSTSPLNYFVIITDGATDTPSNSCVDTHCVSAFDANNCTALKSKGSVGVIYTTYLPLWNENDKNQGLVQTYKDLISPISSQILPNLKACASSSDLFFTADDGPGINSAMQALFLKTQPTTARLTQ
ncbi:MAG: pilus assembly protein [Pseudomonadota bacterium]|nr:pilus assembly protein [Pseudomonadota bacterium]